jgi:hypothetical protein
MRCATKPVLPPCVIESPTAQMENPAAHEATGTITLAAITARIIFVSMPVPFLAFVEDLA